MNFDYIIHAAGYSQPAKFLDDKVKTIKLNTLSTIELLKKLNPQGKFLFVSTSELYNGLEKEFVTESDIGKHLQTIQELVILKEKEQEKQSVTYIEKKDMMLK